MSSSSQHPPSDRLATRRSPLEGVVQAVTPEDPTLTEPQPWGLAVVHGPAPQEGVADHVLPLGPDRWLAVHEEATEGRTSVAEAHGDRSVAEDLSHGMFRIRVSGPHARSVLASGITIDLHPEAFSPGAAAVTAYREIFVVLHAVELDVYDLYVLRSFAASLWEWLADAAAGTEPP